MTKSEIVKEISARTGIDGKAVLFFNDAATTEIYPLSLHDALPISCCPG